MDYGKLALKYVKRGNVEAACDFAREAAHASGILASVPPAVPDAPVTPCSPNPICPVYYADFDDVIFACYHCGHASRCHINHIC